MRMLVGEVEWVEPIKKIALPIFRERYTERGEGVERRGEVFVEPNCAYLCLPVIQPKTSQMIQMITKMSDKPCGLSLQMLGLF